MILEAFTIPVTLVQINYNQSRSSEPVIISLFLKFLNQVPLTVLLSSPVFRLCLNHLISWHAPIYLLPFFHQSPQVSTSFHELIPINHRQLQLQLTSVSASASTWTSAFCEHLARPCGSLRKLLAARCTLLELNGSFPFRPHSPLETPPLQIALLRAKAASLDEDCTSTKKNKNKNKANIA